MRYPLVRRTGNLIYISKACIASALTVLFDWQGQDESPSLYLYNEWCDVNIIETTMAFMFSHLHNFWREAMHHIDHLSTEFTRCC